MDDGPERKAADHGDHGGQEDNAEGARDLIVVPSRDQQARERIGHLGGRDYDAMIDQAEPTADFEQRDRSRDERNPDPADPAHPAAIPECPSDFIDSPRRSSHSRPVISPNPASLTLLLSRSRGPPVTPASSNLP